MSNGKGLKLSVEKLQSMYGNDAIFEVSNNPETHGGMVYMKLKIG